MDNKLMITITCTILATGVIAPFSKSIFDKVFAAYNPDPKKISSGIKKSLIFIFAYISPTAHLIYLNISNRQVDKSFILQSSLLLFVIFLNLIMDIIYYILDKIVFKSINVLIDHQKVIISFLVLQGKNDDLTKETLNNTDITDINKE
jgi:hypothetical protein